MSVVEGAVAVVEVSCWANGEGVKTSSWETSGTGGRAPSSQSWLLHGRICSLRSKKVWERGASQVFVALGEGTEVAETSWTVMVAESV